MIYFVFIRSLLLPFKYINICFVSRYQIKAEKLKKENCDI